jgi:hypothetical protein
MENINNINSDNIENIECEGYQKEKLTINLIRVCRLCPKFSIFPGYGDVGI